MSDEKQVETIGTSTQELLSKLKITAQVAVQPIVEEESELSDEKSSYLVEISGENLGALIGYHGETLNNLQIILSLVINQKLEDKIRIIIDIDGWRKERQKTIESLVQNTISKVRTTGQTIPLPPMNPYERRIVHKLIGQETDIKSFSQGEGMHRATYISPQEM